LDQGDPLRVPPAEKQGFIFFVKLLSNFLKALFERRNHDPFSNPAFDQSISAERNQHMSFPDK
jgi:hypothetical protein